MPDRDLHTKAKKRFELARSQWAEQHMRMRDDIRFSDPTSGEQWSDEAREVRRGRVMMTLDRTNQYILQVVNDARKNKPGIKTMPADSGADVAVAQHLDGIIRHIEYSSRAPIAYDTAIDHSARCGVGWLRVVPKITRPDTKEQDIRILRVHDPLCVTTLGGTEPDGSDMTDAFVVSSVSRDEFEREYPGVPAVSWDDTQRDQRDGESVSVCEWFYSEETLRNWFRIENDAGESFTVGEDEYWDLAKQVGYKPTIAEKWKGTDRTVHWCKLSGGEVLERTTFPSRYLPVVPVLGFESWLDGKRRVCGVTRRLMESQRAYNYERSALVEAIALQPKAPVMVPIDSVQGHSQAWNRLNSGTPAYLPYNHKDADGDPIPVPARLAPPIFPSAFANAGQQALGDMEAAIGLYRANLGAPSNETSGRAIRARQEEGDTAVFHFPDNLARSIEHLGRVVLDMIPRLYDTKRQARILGTDGEQDAIEIDPQGPAVRRQGKRVVAINPGVGTYDVRVVAGANHTTQRADAADGITQILQAAPQFTPVLGPALVKLRDWPDAEKYARMMLALAPPEVQRAISGAEGDEPEIPPQVAAQMQQMQQQMQQMQQMIQQAGPQIQQLQAENAALKRSSELDAAKVESDATLKARELEIKAFEAETDRLQAVAQADAAQMAAQAPAAAPEAPVPTEAPADDAQACAITQMAEQLAELRMLLMARPDPAPPVIVATPSPGARTLTIQLPGGAVAHAVSAPVEQ